MTTRRQRRTLGAALKAYWPYLSGLVVAQAVICLIPSSTDHFQVVAILFFAGFIVAIYPVMRLDAPHAFWVFACIMWYLLAILFAIIATLFRGNSPLMP